jgi:hypothetical protein
MYRHLAFFLRFKWLIISMRKTGSEGAGTMAQRIGKWAWLIQRFVGIGQPVAKIEQYG